MKKHYTVAVIGAGAIAHALHLPGYAKREDVERIVAVDIEPAQLEEAKEKFDIAATYTDYRDMFSHESPDLVSVCTPNAYHAEHALAALRAGAHLLLEKPMTLSLADAEAIRREAQLAGKQVMIGFSHRFNSTNRKIKDIISKGRIGEPFMIRVRFAHGGPFPGWAKSDWFYKPELAGGGALLDMGIHAFDLCNWLLGPVTAVTAQMATLRKPIAVDDNAVITLEFGDRAMGYIEVGWTSGPGFNGLEIYADNGTILHKYGTPAEVTVGRVSPDQQAVARYSTRKLQTPKAGVWDTEMDYFMNTVLKGKVPEMGVDAGIASLAIALAAQESARTGQRIAVKTAVST
jgi:predicted dehydrogenase